MIISRLKEPGILPGKIYRGLALFIIACPLLCGAQMINNGATIVMNSGVSLVLDSFSLQNNGVFNQSGGTVYFTGAVSNSISGSNNTSFFRVNINKPASILELERTISIADQLQFTDGILDLNKNNILLDPAAMLTGESETSRITGPSGGYVQITKNLNAPVADDPGNLGAVITSTNDLGTVIIRRGHQSQNNPTGGGNSILRYYDILPSNNSTLDATLRINYFDAEINGLNENNLSTWKRSINGTWTNLARSSSSIITNFVERNGIADFSRFTLSTFNNPLPLIWSSFNTQCTGSAVQISWKTEQEQNTSLFIIKRSTDGRSWTAIGSIHAAGNSNLPLSYSYSDQQSPGGSVYYQVEQRDFDGHITLSPVLFNNCGVTEEFKVYPNPVLNDCWISLYVARGGAVTLQLFDNKGSLVLVRRESIQTGNNQIHLRMPNLAGGLYSLVVTQPDGRTRVTKIEKK